MNFWHFFLCLHWFFDGLHYIKGGLKMSLRDFDILQRYASLNTISKILKTYSS